MDPYTLYVTWLGSSVVRAPFMRSGCRGFESRSGHLIFSSICSVYIDRHIRVNLSDDEQKSQFVLLTTDVTSTIAKTHENLVDFNHG